MIEVLFLSILSLIEMMVDNLCIIHQIYIRPARGLSLVSLHLTQKYCTCSTLQAKYDQKNQNQSYLQMKEGYFFPYKPPASAGELIDGDPGWSLLLLMSCGI